MLGQRHGGPSKEGTSEPRRRRRRSSPAKGWLNSIPGGRCTGQGPLRCGPQILEAGWYSTIGLGPSLSVLLCHSLAVQSPHVSCPLWALFRYLREGLTTQSLHADATLQRAQGFRQDTCKAQAVLAQGFPSKSTKDRGAESSMAVPSGQTG